MGLFDLFFGTDTSVQNSESRKKENPYLRSCMEEDYYEDTYCDALSGDKDAISEMKEEFGDDWEDEF